MGPNEINIAIAQECGFKLFEHQDGHWSSEKPDGSWYRYKAGINEDHAKRVCLPDFYGDLNAMHEAEKQLRVDNGTVGKYLYALEKICIVSGSDVRNKAEQFRYLHSTAAQRAEAFLKTLNLWKD